MKKVVIEKLENGFVIQAPFPARVSSPPFTSFFDSSGNDCEYRSFGFPNWEEAAVFLANYYEITKVNREAVV